MSLRKTMKAIGSACAANPKLEKAVVWLGHNCPRSRLVSSLCYHTSEQVYSRFPDTTRVAVLDGGAKLEVPLSEHMFRHLYFYGQHEEEVTDLVKHLARPGQTWLDVGANVGFYTILLSRLLGPSGQVHAFEPNPVMVERIGRSQKLNRADNVFVCPKAVSSQSGESVVLHVPASPDATDGGSGRSSLIPQRDVSASRSVSVETIAIDDYLKDNRVDVDYMKIDVEGYEIAAFRGMAKTLRDSPPKIIVSEVSHRPDCLATPQEVIGFIRGFGYVPYSIRRTGLRRLGPDSPLDAELDANIAFVLPEALPSVEAYAGKGSYA